MHILYLSPWFPYPLDTGSRIRAYYLLRGMATKHEVTLLTLNPKGWMPAEIEPILGLCRQEKLIDRDPFDRGSITRWLRFLSGRPIVTKPFPELLAITQELHKQNRFDIVVAATSIMADYALSLDGIPHILEEHNSLTRWMADRYKSQKGLTQRLRSWVSWQKTINYEKWMFRRFDLVTMVSAEDAAETQRLTAKGQPPIEVFPNGVNCVEFHPGLTNPKPGRMIFSGALTYPANFEAICWFLNEIFPLISAEFAEVEVIITGKYNEADLKKLNLDNRVKLLGYVEDIKKAIASSKIAIVPIQSGGGTRIKILEAMALGVPVVTTPKGADGLDVENGRHLLIASDSDKFAESVIRLLRDEALCSYLASNSRRLVELNYDWTGIGQNFVTELENIHRADSIKTND